tara:strand:- start:6953 stop:7870 length:918 start_codon:yes stop_codon:yes gene_type:complete
MKYFRDKGMSIIEALMATAIVGVGFIAVFQMVNFSVNSINTSGERTKASFLSAMVAEGFIGYRDSVAGLSSANRDNLYYYGGKARISSSEGVYSPDNDPVCMKFAEYYLALTSGVQSICAPADEDEGDGLGLEGFEADNNEADDASGNISKPVDHDYNNKNVDLGSVKGILVDKCPKERFTEASNLRPIHGEDAQMAGNAPQNKLIKWIRMFAENRGVKCKSDKDFKSIDIFEMCIWSDKDIKDSEGFVEQTKSCQIPNAKIYDESMFVGRIQINLNDGKKRRFLYFQSDYKIMQAGGKVFDPDS